MTVYYVETTSGDDANTGTATNAAFRNLQRALNVVSASDIIYCAGAETLTSAIAHLRGGNVRNPIQVIGTNANWVNDGSYYNLNANNAVARALNFGGANSHIYMENFIFRNSTGAGVDANSYGNSDFDVFVNCIFTGNAGEGFNGRQSRLRHVKFFNCVFSNNTLIGCRTDSAFLYGCRLNNNSLNGTTTEGGSSGWVIMDSVLYNNTGDNIQVSTAIAGPSLHLFVNCVTDKATANNFNLAAESPFTIMGCRITSAGSNGVTKNAWGMFGYNYMPTLGSERNNATQFAGGGTVVRFGVSGTDYNNTSGTDSLAGYNDPTNADFNLVTSASNYFITIPIP